MAFKMKGHTLPGINQRSETANIKDGRSPSSAFQQKSPGAYLKKTGEHIRKGVEDVAKALAPNLPRKTAKAIGLLDKNKKGKDKLKETMKKIATKGAEEGVKSAEEKSSALKHTGAEKLAMLEGREYNPKTKKWKTRQITDADREMATKHQNLHDLNDPNNPAHIVHENPEYIGESAPDEEEGGTEPESPIKHSLADMEAMGVDNPEGIAFATDPDVQTEKYPMQDFLGEEGNWNNHDQKHALGYTHTGGGTIDQDDVTWQAKNLPRNKEMDEGYEEEIEEKIIEEPIVEDVEPKPQPKWMTEESATPMKSPMKDQKSSRRRSDIEAHKKKGDHTWASHGSPDRGIDLIKPVKPERVDEMDEAKRADEIDEAKGETKSPIQQTKTVAVKRNLDDLSFKKAFRTARDYGWKEFSWRDNSYTTKLKEAGNKEKQ